jgi:hypothetical protein
LRGVYFIAVTTVLGRRLSLSEFHLDRRSFALGGGSSSSGGGSGLAILASGLSSGCESLPDIDVFSKLGRWVAATTADARGRDLGNGRRAGRA